MISRETVVRRHEDDTLWYASYPKGDVCLLHVGCYFRSVKPARFGVLRRTGLVWSHRDHHAYDIVGRRFVLGRREA